jgi:hypothetical protein
MKTKILLTIVLLVSLGVVWRSVSKQINRPSFQDNFIPDIKNELFTATAEDGVLMVSIYSPVKNKIIVSKKILLNAPLGPASTNLYGANDSVQYNAKTKEVFFSTQGYSDRGGDCLNKDGTCVSRIYKISLDQTEPTILFESATPPKNWLVNSFDDSLLLSFFTERSQILKKISGQDGKVIFTKEYEMKEDTGLTDFILSRDGTYTYQARTESVDGKWFYKILKLRRIDNLNGDVGEQDIFSGEEVWGKVGLSPDNNYLTFYLREQEKVYVYEIPRKKIIDLPYRESIRNYSLLWSGDSKKLLCTIGDSLAFYDILSKKSVVIADDLRQISYFHAWAPSINYIAYQSPDREMKILDIEKNAVINTQIRIKYEFKGVSWY